MCPYSIERLLARTNENVGVIEGQGYLDLYVVHVGILS